MLIERKCAYCKKIFIPKISTQIYCSATCSGLMSRERLRQKRPVKKRNGKNRFFCPRCERWHNEPRFLKGDYRQYCKTCRAYLKSVELPWGRIRL